MLHDWMAEGFDVSSLEFHIYGLDIARMPGHHYWIDHLNPWAIHFYGNVGIRWYGVAYVLGLCIAGFIFFRWARQGRLPVPPGEVATLMLYAAAGVILGGRIGYCVFYHLHYVLHHPAWVFDLRQGGMSSHGGILGAAVTICIYARQRDLDAWLLLDAAAATCPIGIFFGRIANFLNGELWGRPTHVPWAVIFPKAPLVNGVNVPRHPSELYAAFIEGIFVLLVGQWAFRRQSHTGLATACACIAYSVGRFIDEFWRQPDLGQPVYWGWMSKGQLLSIPMFIIGVAILWRRSPQRASQASQSQEM